MRIAIISDIHGNLPALEAVLADVAEQHPDAVYCLGDLVGYGASLNEVTERIRAAGIQTIMGNYDDDVGHRPPQTFIEFERRPRVRRIRGSGKSQHAGHLTGRIRFHRW